MKTDAQTIVFILANCLALSGLEKSNASDGETRKAAIISSIAFFVISEKYNITPCAYN